MAATDRGGAPAGALLAAALALPGVAPARAGAIDPRRRRLPVQVPRLPRLAARRRPDARRRARRFFVMKPLPDAGGRRQRSSTTACRARRRCFFNTLSGASGEGVKDYRTAGDVKLTQVLRPLLDRRRRARTRTSATTCRGRLARAALVDRGHEPTFAFGVRRRVGPHQHRATSVASGEKKHMLDFLVGVTQVIIAERDRPVEPHVLARPRLLHRSVQAARRPARPPAHRRVAHALQPGVPGAGRARCSSRSACCTTRSASTSNMIEAHVGAAAAARVRRSRRACATTRRAPRISTTDPPFAERLRARRAVHGRHAAVGVRRVHAVGITDREGVRRRLERRPHASSSTGRRASWRLGGDGSPGLLPFSARWIQVGVSKTF